MVNYTLGDLIHDSFRVTHGMIAVFPQTGHEVTLSVDFFTSKFNGHYSANSSTIGFICQNRYYVTPYTARAVTALVENGFKEASFYVPFSASDYPKREAKRWKFLQEKAKKTPEENFSAECEKFCNEHHIGALPPLVMKKSFLIPNEGLRVKHVNYETHTYPVITQFKLDNLARDSLGTYYMNNGIVVIVYLVARRPAVTAGLFVLSFIIT